MPQEAGVHARIAQGEGLTVDAHGSVLERPHEVVGGVHQHEQVGPVIETEQVRHGDERFDRGVARAGAVPGQRGVDARRSVLEFLVRELHEVLPGASWTAAGVGRHQLTVNHWALELGGHCRTGLEDNVRYDEQRLARSNAELVERVRGLCENHGRPAATAQQARRLLELPARA